MFCSLKFEQTERKQRIASDIKQFLIKPEIKMHCVSIMQTNWPFSCCNSTWQCKSAVENKQTCCHGNVNNAMATTQQNTYKTKTIAAIGSATKQNTYLLLW